MDQKRIEELKARIALDPDNILDRFVLLQTYHEGQAWEDVIREGRELLGRQPNYLVVYILLGEALLRSGKREEARELLLKGQELAIRFGHRAPKEGIEKLLSELV